jgi:hypothetical protein
MIDSSNPVPFVTLTTDFGTKGPVFAFSVPL